MSPSLAACSRPAARGRCRSAALPGPVAPCARTSLDVVLHLVLVPAGRLGSDLIDCGNTPRCCKAKIVERDSPVCACTCLSRRTRLVIEPPPLTPPAHLVRRERKYADRRPLDCRSQWVRLCSVTTVIEGIRPSQAGKAPGSAVASPASPATVVDRDEWLTTADTCPAGVRRRAGDFAAGLLGEFTLRRPGPFRPDRSCEHEDGGNCIPAPSPAEQ